MAARDRRTGRAQDRRQSKCRTSPTSIPMPSATRSSACRSSPARSASAIRTDKGSAKPTSWKDLADPKLCRRARRLYHSGQQPRPDAILMMLGKIYGKGLTDLDAAYKALEQLKPIKLVDFTGADGKDAAVGRGDHRRASTIRGIYRYDGQNQPIAFAAPSEGVLSLEQVLNVTPGTKVKELAYAYIDYMLRPDVQKTAGRSRVVFAGQQEGEARRQVRRKAPTHTEAKVAQLIQPDWKWYNERKDDIDARVTRSCGMSFRRMTDMSARRMPTFVSTRRPRPSTATSRAVDARRRSTSRPGEFFSLLGPVRLRQDHDAAHDRRLRDCRIRAASMSAATTSPTCRCTSATWAWCSSPMRCFRIARWPRTWPSACACAGAAGTEIERRVSAGAGARSS